MPTTLPTIYTLLHAHFGQLHGAEAVRPWWPLLGADAAFEMLVGAVLVQQTRWETVEAAIRRLVERDWLAPAQLAACDPAELAALIRPAAFHRQKAPGLIAIAQHIVARYAGSTAHLLARPTQELRRELLALPRIGYETCDVIMLYGGGHTLFVVDEYTRRLFERVQPTLPDTTSAPIWRAPYEVLRTGIERAITPSAALYADYHAQINEACVRYCLSRPRCDGPPARRVYSQQAGRESYLDRDDGCPLRGVCAFYQSRV
jgi:endonuclease-3 related protein